jgi:hypothetical protein
VQRKQVIATLAGVLAVTVAAVIFEGVTGGWSSDPAGSPGPPVVGPSAPGYDLMRDALRIDAARKRGGITHFAYLPDRRPPGLRRMEEIKTDDDSFTDVYEVGPPAARTVVRYTVEAPGPCPPAECLRNGKIADFSPDAPSLQYVTIRPAGGAEPASTQFWTGTDLVPIQQAAWFADLVREATFVAGRR